MAMQNPFSLVVIDDPEQYWQTAAAQTENRLIDLAKTIASIKLDIRYARTENFTGVQHYPEACAYLRRPAAAALRDAQRELAQKGLGLCIFDAYRPYSVTLKLWDYLRDERYVAAPWTGSRHNRGCAVDLTLVELGSGSAVNMPTEYDDFSERAHQSYTRLPADILDNRQLLTDVMLRHHFTPLATEWWHFDFTGWENYALLDLPFAALREFP